MQGDYIYLVQTDTTVGLLSQNREKLNLVKQRDRNKKILREVDSLKTLKLFTRVPNKFKNLVRRANKTTFIYLNNHSFRVVKDERHLEFLKKFKYLYSTSANLTNKKFDYEWAISVADVIVGTNFSENRASKIIKLGHRRLKRLR